ncbi:release factor glutamine methyltransferase [Humidesulfovibrio mexicanus]|uniref:Release factor glutamine methyltransferase n=1 Tax=Humidesulfovibrio mexicanus TaxID=147047 RepID=A0A238XTC4_9BACT|nr:peptide chain release factor N(5)-glutamine methyltransferase [Humidesulfovibrio mexicanus]SNR61818.1 release factor glutamine methyltransferase [Humidesulfovibrio mexicanus]
MAGPSSPGAVTVEAEILAASRALAEAEVDSPRLSAELLATMALGCDRLGLVMRAKQPFPPAELARFRVLLARRANGEPIAYILGQREFWGLPLLVTPDVLIPRPETERIVEEALTSFDHAHPLCFTDFGTGSGALAVALAHEFRAARGLAIDLSAQALLVARANAIANGVAERLLFLRADFTLFACRPGTLDLVVSNPPYVTEEEYGGLSREVRGYEPRQALVSPEHGLWHLRKLLPVAARALRSGGRLLCEIGCGQGRAALDLVRGSACGFDHARILPDHAGLDRLLSVERHSHLCGILS